VARFGIGMRWWLALAFASIAALTALLVAAVSSQRTAQGIRSNAQDIAVGKTVSAAFAVERAVRRGDLANTLEVAGSRRDLALFVFAPDGTAMSPVRSAGIAWRAIPRHGAALAAALHGHRFVESSNGGDATLVALPLRRTASARALVAFAPNPRAYSASLSIFHREVIRAALWAVLVAAGTGLLAAALVAARLRRIGAAAQAIERGSFETPLRPRFRDEVGALASTIDRMRQRLSDSFAALTAERDRLGRVLERLHEGVVTVDADCRIELANAAARRLLDRPLAPGAELDEPWQEVSLGDFARRLFRPDAHVAEVRVTLAGGISCAILGIPPRRPEQGETAVLVLSDITERDRRERAEREFVANAAHELRTPLTTITGAVEMLESGAKDVPEDRDRFLSHIKAEAVRLVRLTRALLVLPRAQTREEPLRLTPVALRPLLEEVAAGLQPPEGVAVELDCPPSLEALTERDLAGQVAANLAENAIKHTARGAVRLCGRALPSGVVQLEISDTGAGMPPAVRQRVFDRFYRAGERDEQGFGLGLAIVREAVRALGGVIELESSPGVGTVARVTLPGAFET
jgi:signal transduction histidine kinase